MNLDYGLKVFIIKIGDERERLITALPVMTKSRTPAGGNNDTENGLVKPP
jgi:hypothetical protein